MVKLNNSDEYESLGVIKLTKERFPKAFAAKVEELLEEHVCYTQEEAESLVRDMEFELECRRTREARSHSEKKRDCHRNDAKIL